MKNIFKSFRQLFFPQPIALSIAPFIIPAVLGGVSLLSNILPRVIGKGKREKKLAAAAETFDMPEGIDQAVELTRNVARQGDPYAGIRQRQIDRGSANTLGQVKATTGSVQDVLNAVQGISERKGAAEERNIAASKEYKINLEKQLANMLRSKGLTQLQVDQLNQRAVESEAARQSADMQGYATSGQNLGSDVFSSLMLAKQFDMFGDKQG